MVKKKIIIISIISILVVIIGALAGAYYYLGHTIYKPSKKENIFTTKAEEEKAQYAEEHGVFNILLCGLDGRTKDSDSRTDSMIVATIDTNNKSVKLVSFMRDLYVPIPGHGQTRLNSAFSFGGPELLMKTLNQDFNFNIQYYVTIDFKAFQAMVDKVGGIDVEVKDYELKQINYYIREANWNNPSYLKQAGYQHLNGQQALSYCRIRKVGNNDYERTERQRRVISLLITKAKKMSIFELPQFITTVLPYVKTNIPTPTILNLGFTVFKFGTMTVNTARIPADNMFQGMKINGADVLVPDMDKNIVYLDNFLSSTGSVGETNLPAYMTNNFHINDIAIDKRGLKHKTVKIIIPRNSKKTNSLEPTSKDNPNLKDEVPPASDGNTNTGTSVDSNGDNSNGNTNNSNDSNTKNTTTESGVNVNTNN